VAFLKKHVIGPAQRATLLYMNYAQPSKQQS
jgi:hypothetical protein